LNFSSEINRVDDSLLADSQQNLFGTKVALSFEPRTGQSRLTEEKGQIMEGILFITLSGVSLVGLLSMFWLWRP